MKSMYMEENKNETTQPILIHYRLSDWTVGILQTRMYSFQVCPYEPTRQEEYLVSVDIIQDMEQPIRQHSLLAD